VPREETLEPGTLIGGRYRIQEVLGSGAMGTVYRAFQDSLRRDVAIKTLRPELSRELSEVRRFLIEARAAGKVDHPNVVSVLDFGRDSQGQYFLVMEYVSGRLLSDVIAREGPFDQARVLHLLRQVFAAVAQAHRQNIIHRDLKPQNIICTVQRGDRDFVKVLDFGIAKILGDESLARPVTENLAIGTPEYMSPEQIEGKTVDHRCDLYSVGVMTYEMLTGVVPFDGTIDEIMLQHLQAEPRPLRDLRPDVHPDLEFLVRTLMAKDRESRFSRAEAVLNVVARIAAEIGMSGDDERGRALPDGAPRPQPAGRGSRQPPTTWLAVSPTSAWETSDLVSEIGRLAQLWARRVSEVADALWGSDSRPDQVGRWLADIEAGERRITEAETRIAVLRDEVVSLDTRFRDAETELRLEHLDLAARQGSVRAVLEEAMTAGSEGPMLSDGRTAPSFLDVEGQEPIDTSVNIELPEHVRDGARAASDTILSEAALISEPSTSLSLADATQDPVTAQAEFVRLEREIAVLDIEVGRVIDGHRLAVAERERAIMTEVEKVNSERARLVPSYQDLAGFVARHAGRRPDLSEHIGALEQVARAIMHHQLVLQQVQADRVDTAV
jgi:serine/threonine protein kinase